MPAIAGISGGRTSALMAHRLNPDVVLCFQNTGLEAAGTLDFIDRLEQDLGQTIHRLEFRAPARGLAPINATFEIVEHPKLARTFKDSPFRDMLECLKTYRAAVKGLGPVAPWARSRICTAYLKIRTQRKFCASLGWGHQREYTEYVGLRADEPARVARMRERNEKLDTDERAPLFDDGITKADVLKFWGDRPYDLEVPEHMGNCTGCFLKDEADLATALLQPETDAASWISIEAEYAPMRRGRASYAQVYAEAPDRMRIREALARGEAFTVELPKKRIKLIVAQEVDRAKNGATGFSCECDAAKAEDFDEAACITSPFGC